MMRERRHDVVRILVEPGQHYNLLQKAPFGGENPVKITNLIVVPPPDWKPSGAPGEVRLHMGERDLFSAPIDILRAEWQRYQAGVSDQLFHSVILPVRKPTWVVNESIRPIVIDLFISYYVNV
jgi:hypothetical protein